MCGEENTSAAELVIKHTVMTDGGSPRAHWTLPVCSALRAAVCALWPLLPWQCRGTHKLLQVQPPVPRAAAPVPEDESTGEEEALVRLRFMSVVLHV